MGDRITLRGMGVSDRQGNTTFWIANYGRGGSEQDMIGVPPWATQGSVCPVSVPMTTLDAAVGDRPVVFAKVDAQGHDAEVVFGARQLLTGGRLNLLQLEVSPGLAADGGHAYLRAIEMLSSLGFTCYTCETSDTPTAEPASKWIQRLSQRILEVPGLGGDQGGYGNLVCKRARGSTTDGGASVQPLPA